MPDVLMPRLSDTMTEGVISAWLKHEGDQVQRGDILAEIETDKATMEMEAYDSGVLTRIIAPEGTTVPIGQPIAVIGEPSSATGSSSTEQQAKSAAAVHVPSAPADHAPADDEPHLRATPLVRSLAREHAIDLTTVRGTGPGGRIVRADIEGLIGEHPSAAAKSTVVPGVLVPTRGEPAPGLDGDERIPLASIRRITAQRLTESAAAPHFHLTAAADVGALMRLRTELNADVPVKISITDLLIRACAVALTGHLDVNSSWGGDHLVRHHRVNIGCAVAADAGLLVPVVSDANHKSLTEIAAEAHGLIDRARAGRLTPAELSGGTFTISNLGGYGVEAFTAVINPPEAAILAVGTVTERAVVRDGEFTAAQLLTLTLTVDHRVLDGAAAAAFLQDLVQLLQHPLRMLV